MVVPAYLKERQKRTFSKYHRFQNLFSSQYTLIKNELVSKFHIFGKKRLENIDRSTFDFVARYDLLSIKRDEEDNQKIKELMQPVKINNFELDNLNFQENIDWRRGRILGDIVSIVVNEGLIIEKVFLTPRGSRVLVKRTELGLFSKLRCKILQTLNTGLGS